MPRIIESSIIIKDDFNNIYIIRKKAKRNEPKLWYLVGRKLRGKDTPEKCVLRAIKEDLKAVIFDLKEYEEINLSEEESCMIFTGELKERVTYGTDVVEGKWVSKEQIEQIELAKEDKEKILRYFNSLK